MRMRAWRTGRRVLAGGGVVGLLMLGQAGVAQDDAPIAPPIELDVQTLIDSAGNSGRNARFQDPVWDIRPESGRETVLVPIHLTVGQAEYEVSRPSVGVRSGRFVGWYIPDAPGNNNAGPRGGNDDTLRAGDPDDLASLLMGEDTPGDRGRDELAGQLDAVDAATDGSGHPPVPADAPRLARSLTVYPDGSVGWEMDRAFNGAEPKPAGDNNLYGYKLDPRALRDAEPPRPERLERQDGESSRDYSNRRRQQQEDHRAAMNDFRALRDELRELPEAFREPLPQIVYAVFDAPERDGWSFTGDDPLPWEMDEDDLAALADLAQARSGGSDGLDERTSDAASELVRVANRGGAMDHRAIALAAHQGGLAAQVTRNDPGYILLRTLLSSDDREARTIALVSIARVQPPTRASAQLLADAADRATGDAAPALQLASLRSSLRIEAGPDGNTGLLLSQVNEALGKRGGPPPARVLEELIDAIEPADNGRGPGRGGAAADPDTATQSMLVSRVEFDRIPADAMPDVIAMVIRRSPESALAAGWLDRQLLRSADLERTDNTLRMLARADRSSRIVRPLTDEVRALVFGQASADPDAAEPRPVIDGVIALDSEQHGLVLALTSNDPARSTLGWAVLRHFEIVAAGSGRQDDARAIFDRIVDIGLDTEGDAAPPISLVDFIDNQTDSALAEHARGRMLDLLIAEGMADRVARRAARKVVGTGRDYRQAMAGLEPGRSGDVADRVYELITGEVPAVVGLVRDRGQGNLVRWLAESWQQGKLPTPADWADAAGDQDQLIQLAGSSNRRVSAGAASAMVIRAGGTAEHEERFIQALARGSDTSAAGVAAAWEPIKRDIFAGRLSDAAGAYRLVLNVYPQAPDAGRGGNRDNPRDPGLRDPRGPRSPGRLTEPATNPGGLGGPGDIPRDNPRRGNSNQQPTQTLDLGVVQLQVQGDEVALSVETVPLRLADERLALRIDDVSTLASLNHPDLADLPLSQLKEPIDLLPAGNDAWAGRLTLPDGRVLEVSLTRE